VVGDDYQIEVLFQRVDEVGFAAGGKKFFPIIERFIPRSVPVVTFGRMHVKRHSAETGSPFSKLI
jgi:hypothetical protein